MEQANRRRKYVEFEVGDLVWVHLHKDRFLLGKFGKLKPRVDDPFKIINFFLRKCLQVVVAR